MLVQTAAHVAGAVEYVFKSRLTSPEYAKVKLAVLKHEKPLIYGTVIVY